MLFEKTIEPRCAYCRRSAPLKENLLLCKKRGLVSPGDHCRSFRYDPLRRIPPAPPSLDLGKLREEDFVL